MQLVLLFASRNFSAIGMDGVHKANVQMRAMNFESTPKAFPIDKNRNPLNSKDMFAYRSSGLGFNLNARFQTQ